jgi:hypothetical protein
MIKGNKLEKIFEEILTKTRFQEMSMHCGRSDGYGMIIAVGSGFQRKGGQKKEHNPPHAHIWSIDKTYESRFRIDSEKLPENLEELLTVDESDPSLKKFAEKLIEWVGKPSKRYKGNNWEAMRQSWRDIQEMINEGLAQTWYI